MNMKTFIAVAFTLSCILTVGVEGANTPKRECPEVKPKPTLPEFGQPNLSPIGALLSQSAKSCLQKLPFVNEEHSDMNKTVLEYFIKLMDLTNFNYAKANAALNCLSSGNVGQQQVCLILKMPHSILATTLQAFIEFNSRLQQIADYNHGKQRQLFNCLTRKHPAKKSKYQILHQIQGASDCALKQLDGRKVAKLDDGRFHFEIELASYIANHQKVILPVLHCLECRLMDKAADFKLALFSKEEEDCIKKAAAKSGFDELSAIVNRFSNVLKDLSNNNVMASKGLLKCIR